MKKKVEFVYEFKNLKLNQNNHEILYYEIEIPFEGNISELANLIVKEKMDEIMTFLDFSKGRPTKILFFISLIKL